MLRTLHRLQNILKVLDAASTELPKACTSGIGDWHTLPVRALATKPDTTIYSGPKSGLQRINLRTLRRKYARGEKLSMVTAYDYPSAVHVDQAGADMLLVGDSAGMVVHGHDTTLPVTMEQMLTHCAAAARGAQRPFLIGDLPFGSYECGAHQAVASATRFLKEGGMDAVKLEGGSPARIEAARAIVDAGIACMGHIGLTPQSVSAIGGFRPQAQSAPSALELIDKALALEAAGVFAMVLECVPAPIAAAATAAIGVPTIGIGAGPACSGQVLVFHDLLGMLSHPHHTAVTPKFCKQYAHVGVDINAALREFVGEVESGAFPGAQFSPYKIQRGDLDAFTAGLRARGLEEAAEGAEGASESAGLQ